MQVKNVIVAEATWPGTVAASIYRQGQTYSDRVSALERQKALGWRVEIQFGSPTNDRAATRVQIGLQDKHGEPVSVRESRVTFVHPLQEALDSEPIRLKAMGAGQYRMEHQLPQAGRWQLQFVAQAADGTLFRRDFEIRIPTR